MKRTMVRESVLCPECDLYFQAKASVRRRGQGKFCSLSCRNKNGFNSGERNKNAKLTWDDIVQIRESYVPYKCSVRDLAKRYGLSRNQTFDILKYRAWTA